MKSIPYYESIPPLKNNFTVKFNHYSQTFLFSHWHEHTELLYIISGRCTFTCNGESFIASAGDLIVINKNEVHSYIADDCLDYYCLLIHPAFFNDINFFNIRLENRIKCNTVINDCINGIKSEYFNNSDNDLIFIGSDMVIKSYTYALMAHLIRNHTITHISSKEQKHHLADLKRLDMIFRYISDNYSEKISTSTLAGMCYLSESYFCRFFKATTGKTVINYINEYRIEKATALLKETDDSISEIAANIGFDDANYFSRVFKKIMKKTPNEYRANAALSAG